MNREIKFRGYCPDLKRLFFGGLDRSSNFADFIIYPFVVDGAGTTTTLRQRVSTDSIGQYTGLKDIKGKEIYEGDIVKWGHIKGGEEYNIRIAEVKINPDLCFDCKNISRPHVFHFGSFMYRDTEKWLEIIGNIHENPELIK